MTEREENIKKYGYPREDEDIEAWQWTVPEKSKKEINKMNKIYLGHITTRDGDFEYGDDMFVEATNIDEAMEKLTEYARLSFDGETLAEPYEDGSKWYEEPDGYRLVRVSIRSDEICTFAEALDAIGLVK